jgi:hypothetical protein
MRPRAVLDADSAGEHVHTFSLHFSGYDREKHDEGRCHYIPVNLGEISDYYRRFMAGGHRRVQDLSAGRARLLQSQRRQPVASRHRRTRPPGDRP